MLLFPYDLVLFYTWLGAPFCLVKIYDMLLSDAASWSSVHRMSCALREKLNFNSCWSYSYSSWWCLVLFLSSFGSLFTCCFCFCCYGTCKCSLDPLVPLLTANWSYLKLFASQLWRLEIDRRDKFVMSCLVMVYYPCHGSNGWVFI